jgi:hypothetical protein
VELTVEEKIENAEKHIHELNEKLDKEVSWFSNNGCLKVLSVFSILAIILFGVAMFIIGHHQAEIKW